MEAVNIYHSETNQCDSHSMRNEDMGLDIIQKLIKKILKMEIKKENTKTQFNCDNIDNGANAPLC